MVDVGLEVDPGDAKVRTLLEDVKQREFEGYDAVLYELTDELVNLGLGADVDASGRLVEEQESDLRHVFAQRGQQE